MSRFERLRHLWNAYRALRAGKHPDDVRDMLDMMERDAESEEVRTFARQAKTAIGDNVTDIELQKDGVDFTAEASVLFLLGARWERHDIFTGDDLDGIDWPIVLKDCSVPGGES